MAAYFFKPESRPPSTPTSTSSRAARRSPPAFRPWPPEDAMYHCITKSSPGSSLFAHLQQWYLRPTRVNSMSLRKPSDARWVSQVSSSWYLENLFLVRMPYTKPTPYIEFYIWGYYTYPISDDVGVRRVITNAALQNAMTFHMRMVLAVWFYLSFRRFHGHNWISELVYRTCWLVI